MALNSLGANSSRRGVVLEDINPNRETGSYQLYIGQLTSRLPINGYKKISINYYVGESYYSSGSFRFVLKDGTTQSISLSDIPRVAWSQYFDIPTNALFLEFQLSVSAYPSVYYSLLA